MSTDPPREAQGKVQFQPTHDSEGSSHSLRQHYASVTSFLLAPRHVPGQLTLRSRPLLGASPDSRARPCHVLLCSGKKQRPCFPQATAWIPGAPQEVLPHLFSGELRAQRREQHKTGTNRNEHEAGVSRLQAGQGIYPLSQFPHLEDGDRSTHPQGQYQGHIK